MAGARLSSTNAAGSRIALDAGVDATAVLDRVRAHADVFDFGVEAPTLSEMFLAVTRPLGAAAGDASEGSA